MRSEPLRRERFLPAAARCSQACRARSRAHCDGGSERPRRAAAGRRRSAPLFGRRALRAAPARLSARRGALGRRGGLVGHTPGGRNFRVFGALRRDVGASPLRARSWGPPPLYRWALWTAPDWVRARGRPPSLARAASGPAAGRCAGVRGGGRHRQRPRGGRWWAIRRGVVLRAVSRGGLRGRRAARRPAAAAPVEARGVPRGGEAPMRAPADARRSHPDSPRMIFAACLPRMPLLRHAPSERRASVGRRGSKDRGAQGRGKRATDAISQECVHSILRHLGPF